MYYEAADLAVRLTVFQKKFLIAVDKGVIILCVIGALEFLVMLILRSLAK